MTFESFMRAHGLVPGPVSPDGRWRRCPTESHPRRKNGSYKLALDGQVGWCQDFAVHVAPVMWRPDREETYTPPPIDHAAIARRAAEERRRAVQATQAARAFYASCEPLLGGHPYLTAHGLDMAGCRGLKVDREGWLVVPALRERNLMTVQRISPEGDKRFWPGAPVKGASYTVDRPTASITVLCEGLATGLAVFAAASLCRVVVAFNSGNLARVALPPGGMLTIAADNDHGTEGRTGINPGVEAAQKAAEAFGGGVALPSGMQGSDWSDWRQEMIAARVAKKLPHQRESEIRRSVDAEIVAAISRSAKFRQI